MSISEYNSSLRDGNEMSASSQASLSTMGSSSASVAANLTSSLCFTKDIFYASTFDIDAFLTHYKREFTLERLRDDLNIFLKVLEMSMSELINKDYPDFVNLSTNLVDLDKAINDLKRPLEMLKLEIETVQESIDEETQQVMSKLNEKLNIEKRRIVLKLLINWQRSLKVTNEMIANNNSSESSQKITGDYVERVAFEFCQLKNSLSICSGENTDSISQNNDINKLSQVLEKIMKELLLSSLNIKEGESSLKGSNLALANAETKQQLRHVLKSYSLLSKQRLAEQLFTEYLVKPYMSEYLNESFFESNIQQLEGVYDKVLEFIDQNSEFLKITSEIKLNINSSEPQKHQISESDFDFLINSIWSHVILCLDLNLNSIFSPVDPDVFHRNFTISHEFMSRFEQKCSQYDRDNFKRKFYSCQSYKYFVKKWPVQVYYQLRFQEIVSKLEEELIDCDKLVVDTEDNSSFKLNISNVLVAQLEYCWLESKCFLKCLLGQFWQLNLQMISRYSNFFIELFRAKIQAIGGATSSSSILSVSSSQTTRSKSPTPDEQIPARSIPSGTNIASSKPTTALNDLDLSILVLADVEKLISIKLPNFFDGIIAPALRSANAIKDLSALKEAFSCSIAQLSDLQLVVIDYVVKYQTEKSLAHLKSASDIPRLYRRTNREAPKSSSMYVGLTVDAIYEFKQAYLNSEGQRELVEKCIQNIIDSLCIKYQSIASDLLESVKKMEDSLKRLQQFKNRSNRSLASSQAANAMSDDDKIRLQLSLDILEFGRLLEEKFEGYKGETNYDSLYKLVEEINQTVNKKEENIMSTSMVLTETSNAPPIHESHSESNFVTEENETAATNII